ncbi:type VI secretion system ImpA family N-terminal domain-containing protein [Bradyrhizobium sp. 183]|uniref:type VI secretion system ImpA family N-terminal domain-containing protein n=1 Tax=unclassified Bradyrhizobium TaxID=2631580 RepID=UPI001FFF4046|nr:MULTISPECIES: type VI secretion system ImpA family N-terminal domain-containing protein [unclassified Bradyrhizobium]UPJ79248.1 type VI secretion system ImpA family N-terminal domain-containing protein [Bradyrhizobium sp. 184]UPJ87041.1 type VI secretion system ImpA family N-terminal domain-containing protein [Bradyrhizobium sp. 183]
MIDYSIGARADIDAPSPHGVASSPRPAGTNFRESTEFDRLETEMRLTDAAEPAAVDWTAFSTLSLSSVLSQPKDILVGCWVSYGLFQTDGCHGLAVGSGVYEHVVDAHWEGLYSSIERKRERVGVIDWLIGGHGREVPNKLPTEADYPVVLIACDVLDDLDRELREILVNEQVIDRDEIALRTGQASDRVVRVDVPLSGRSLRADHPRSGRSHRLRCRPPLDAPQTTRLAGVG